MTMQEIFEGNRERLTAAVSGADPVSAVPVLNAELDRMLYTFNDQEENPRVREAAGAMMQVAKAACALVDTAGETKIYGRTEYGRTDPHRKRPSKPGLALLILGLAAAAAGVVCGLLAASAGAAAQVSGLPPRWLLACSPAAAALLLFFAGLLLRSGKAPGKETLHAEMKLDPSLVFTRLLTVILVMDKQLEEVRSTLRLEERERRRAQTSAMDPAELELLSRLLEDAYGRRGEDGLAEEEISQIRFYLHGKHVEVVDWAPEAGEQGAWFDMMPAYAGGTLRPALVADGALLKKGMASAGRG